MIALFITLNLVPGHRLKVLYFGKDIIQESRF